MTDSLSNRERQAEPREGGAKFLALYVLPTVILLLLAFWPIIGGDRTLYFRDISAIHLEMKWLQAESMRHGHLPIIDHLRGGGQPHLGNPNTVALYPDNVLFVIADTFWALNAHFWLHLLLAPIALFWLARAWGMTREAAWVAGVAYGASGYIFSGLNLYNMIAGMAWAPVLAAAAVKLAARSSTARWYWAVALVWALLVVSGDPVTAALALPLAFVAVCARHGIAGVRWRALATALGLGTLVAAPLVLEFLRVLSLSFRGHWGYSTAAAMIGSWHPVRALEWFVPLAFGAPDSGFWGLAFHSGHLPLLFSLSPGIVVMAFALVGYREGGKLARWSLVLMGGGIFFALGAWNPLVILLTKLPGGGLFRLPVKFWLLVAVGGSLLAALGAEKLLAGGRSAAMTRAAALLAMLLATLWLVFAFGSGAVEDRLENWMSPGYPGTATDVRLRLAGLTLMVLLVAIGSLLVSRLGRRRLQWAVPALLVLHVASQLFLLRSLYPSDEIATYRTASPVTDIIPAGARVVHGASGKLFVPNEAQRSEMEGKSLQWTQAGVFEKLFPTPGMMAGRKYEFTLTPEGLDSFLMRATAQALGQMNDGERLRVLAASGVEWLLMEHGLDEQAVTDGLAELVEKVETRDGPLLVYRLPRAAREAQFVGTLHPSEHLNGAISTILSPDFDPRSQAVLEGRVDAGTGAAGTVAVTMSGPERLVVEVDADGTGALLVQRSHLPHYRATVDGQPASIRVANLFRMAIPLTAGSHTVELWVDRGRFRLGVGLSVVALVMLFLTARGGRLGRLAGIGRVKGEF